MRRLALMAIAVCTACASSNTAPGPSNTGAVRVAGGVGSGDAGARVISTGSTPIAGESMVAAPATKVWEALPGVYDSLGIAIGTTDLTSRSIGNRNLQIRRQLGGVRLSKYIDCGSPQARPSADFYDVNLSIVTQLAPVDSANTKVITTVDAMARPVSFSGEYVRCPTTGEIEAKISEMLKVRASR
jgi:hypothetical protein